MPLSFFRVLTKGLPMKKLLWIVISVIACILGLWSMYGEAIQTNIKNDRPYPFYNQEETLIAHAGGKIDGKVYTNSLEAIEGSIKAGRTLVEVDFIKTADGIYVAGYDWEMINKITGTLTKAILLYLIKNLWYLRFMANIHL